MMDDLKAAAFIGGCIGVAVASALAPILLVATFFGVPL